MILTNISSHLSCWTWTSLVYLTHGCLPSSLDSQRGLEVPKSTAKTHKSLISHRNQNVSLLGVPKLFFRKPLILKHAQWTSYHSGAACPRLNATPSGDLCFRMDWLS